MTTLSIGFNCLRDAECYVETVYFWLLSPQEFLVFIWSTLEGHKTELILKTLGGFELRTVALGIKCLIYKAISLYLLNVIYSPLLLHIYWINSVSFFNLYLLSNTIHSPLLRYLYWTILAVLLRHSVTIKKRNSLSLTTSLPLEQCHLFSFFTLCHWTALFIFLWCSVPFSLLSSLFELPVDSCCLAYYFFCSCWKWIFGSK